MPHAVAVAADVHEMAVVHQAVDEGSGHHVVAEDLAPLVEGFVAGEHGRGKPVTARIRVAFPQSRWVVGEGLGRVVRPVTRDGGTELEFSVRTKDPFLRWLLTFGPQVEVLSPPSLKRDLAQVRERIRARYD